MMRTLYRVMGVDAHGRHEEQASCYTTHEEALAEADECEQMFKGVDFYVEPYEYKEPKERTYAHPNSIDGWEDMYPQED